MFSIFKPYIFSLDPEVAHDLAIQSLKLNILPKSFFSVEDEHFLETKLLNEKIPNPIGLAAGFDKDAEVYNSIFRLGFGFVEVGTITPLKQSGNPKPRVFRLEEDEALINRLGFNNSGADLIQSRIRLNPPKGLFGINIGPNKDTKDRINDYLIGLRKFYELADYLTINISSPNTENLRSFHNESELNDLLQAIEQEKESLKTSIPTVLKISPDINDQELEKISKLILKYNIPAIIVSNTSDRTRDVLKNINKLEKGGLSGKPLQNISTKLIKRFYKDLKGRASIIGVGGIDSGNSAFEKIAAGASALQLYTSMIYEGPLVVKKIKRDLIKILNEQGFKNIKEAIGSYS